MAVEVFCGPLPAAAADTPGVSAAIDADNCSSSRQVLGTECHVTCLPGFELGQPVDTYTCQYDGRALWYPASSPVCYGRLSSSIHTAVRKTKYCYVVMSCRDYYHYYEQRYSQIILHT